MYVIVFVSATVFNVQISPTFCESMYVCAWVSACLRAVCFVFKYFCFLGCFFVLCFMPLTSKTLRGHIGLGLSVRLSVCPYVCLSVCLHAHLQFGRQKDRQLQTAREISRSCSTGWWELESCKYLFSLFLSVDACSMSACLKVYTHDRTYACTRTYLPTNRQTDRQKVWLSDSLTDNPHPHVLWERKKEIVFFTG